MNDVTLTIRSVSGTEDAEAVAKFVWAFFALLRVRYPEIADAIETYIERQDVAGELERLGRDGPPQGGACLLARQDGAPVGVLMMKRLDAEACEMNRMYVAEAARGRGLGRALALRLMQEARLQGYRVMRLDALNRHVEALPLYRSLGFVPDPHPSESARANPLGISLCLTL